MCHPIEDWGGLALFLASLGNGIALGASEEIAMKDLASILMVVAFLVFGTICLFYPERIQQYALRYYAVHRTFAEFNPFLHWMKTRSYVLSLRFLGLLGIVGGLFGFYALCLKFLGISE